MDISQDYEVLLAENAQLKSQLEAFKQEQTYWKNLALENERLLQAEQQARSIAELAEQRANFLSSASNFLTTFLDYHTNIAQLTHMIVPQFADWCAVDLLDEQGKLARIAVSSADPANEEFLRETYRYYPLNLQGPHPIAQVLREGKTLLTTRHQAPKRPTTELTGPASQYQDLFATDKPQSYIIAPLQANGQTLGVFVFMRLQGKPPYVQGDVTLVEDLAAKLALAIQNSNLYAAAQAALETQKELDYYKDLYLSMVSHELRNPLASIKGYAQIIRRKLQTRVAELEVANPAPTETNSSSEAAFEKELKAANIVISQADRMNNMVNELLDFSRIQNRTFELNYTMTLDFVELLKQVAEEQTMLIKTHPLTLDLKEQQITGIADTARLEQLLTNLISNAAKYSPNGTPINVSLEKRTEPPRPGLTDESDWVLISVKDRGYGIAEEAQTQLFERYYRVRTDDNRAVQGLGLGLYISRAIARQHGGDLWLDSQVGVGSTFYLALPLQGKKGRALTGSSAY